MDDDIVKQLGTILDSEMSPTERAVICAAADEIERLRDLAYKLEHDLTCRHSFCSLCGAGIAEWDDYKEARRG